TEEPTRPTDLNVKCLSTAEEKHSQREDKCGDGVRLLADTVQEAEPRAEFAERSVAKLEKTTNDLQDQPRGTKGEHVCTKRPARLCLT
uniref:Uncharacterized protein n=1 Tax=Panthera leo TaxID=9689 RepID=A0A8C8XD64_PANLE